MDKLFLDSLKNSTPVFSDFEGYEDADDEMLPIAREIKKSTQHNEYIEPERIKFLYSDKPKKDGGRYGLFELSVRSKMEKMINDQYDFVLTIFYHVWKDLEPEHKAIQLDKALCSINMGDMESPKIGKRAPDSKEFTPNMHFFGADKVMKTSQLVDNACQSVIEKRKESKKGTSKKDVEALDDVI